MTELRKISHLGKLRPPRPAYDFHNANRNAYHISLVCRHCGTISRDYEEAEKHRRYNEKCWSAELATANLSNSGNLHPQPRPAANSSKIVFFDTETNGLIKFMNNRYSVPSCTCAGCSLINSNEHVTCRRYVLDWKDIPDLLSISAIKINLETGAMEAFTTRWVKWENPEVINPEALAINGITFDLLNEKGIPMLQVINEFLEFISDAKELFAYNAVYDAMVLGKCLWNYGVNLDLFKNKIKCRDALRLDTIVWNSPIRCIIPYVKHSFPNRKDGYRLVSIFYDLYGHSYDAHDSMTDTLVSALVYFFCIRKESIRADAAVSSHADTGIVGIGNIPALSLLHNQIKYVSSVNLISHHIINACAGAGKSTALLAIADALCERRLVDPPIKKFRMLYITYSRKLRDALSAAAYSRSCYDHLDIETIHSCMAKRSRGHRGAYFDMHLEADLADHERRITPMMQNGRYSHIFIDEAQDFNDLYITAMKVIWHNLCAPGTTRVFITGDSMQTIYRTLRNAHSAMLDPSILSALGFIDSNYELVRLNTSFRVPPVIADFINKIMPPAAHIISASPGSGKVEIIDLERPQDMSDIIRLTRNLISRGYKPSDIAIIIGTAKKWTLCC
jgi:DNA polymerase III epsilon subunit-like protein